MDENITTSAEIITGLLFTESVTLKGWISATQLFSSCANDTSDTSLPKKVVHKIPKTLLLLYYCEINVNISTLAIQS